MTDQERPAAGGSYLRKPDGSLERRRWTRGPGDPDHAARRAPAPAAKPAPAKPAKKEK
jgi:hypothetical protein